MAYKITDVEPYIYATITYCPNPIMRWLGFKPWKAVATRGGDGYDYYWRYAVSARFVGERLDWRLDKVSAKLKKQRSIGLERTYLDKCST